LFDINLWDTAIHVSIKVISYKHCQKQIYWQVTFTK